MSTFSFEIKNILVPIDFSATSLAALDYAVYMAKLNKATVTLVHTVESLYGNTLPENYYVTAVNNAAVYEKELYEKAKQHLEALAAKTEKKGKIKVVAVAGKGWVKEHILETERKIKADIIVMGTHGVKGFREFIIGSNTFRVINEAKCPVLSVQKTSITPTFKNILMAFRDKPHSREKVNYAIKMAEIYKAKINVLGIDTEGTKAHLKKIQLEADQIQRIIEKRGITCEVKVKSSGYISDKLLRYATKVKADLIVIMADMDKMNISEYFMGPFSQQIVNHSTKPILSIRPAYNPNTINLHGYGW